MGKKLLLIVLMATVLLTIAPLPSFADSTYSFIVPKADSNLGADSLSTTSINAYTFNNYTYNSGNTHIDKYNGHQVNSTSYPDDVYFFGLRTLVNGANGQYYSYSIVYCVPAERVVPTGSASYPSIRYNNTSQSTITSTNMSTNKTLDSETQLYYSNGASSMELDTVDGRLNFPVNVNMYDSRAEGLAAVRDAIENGTTGGGGSYNSNVTIEVKSNYVAFIGFANGSATLNMYTGGGNDVFYPPFVSNASYWFADSLPTGTSFARDTSGDKIIFRTGIGKRTSWLGYYQVQTTMELDGVRYLVIYNPYNRTNEFNYSIFATIENYVSCVQYPLNTTIGFSGLESVFSDSNFFVAQETEDNSEPEYLEYQEDSNGNVTTSPAISLPAGGNNIIPESDGGIDGFIESILSIFTAPIRYIQNLVDSGSNFMAWISQLWYWLPPEVGVIIGSALAVIVVIGAIKLLWK